MGGVPAAVTLLAVADGAVRAIDLAAKVALRGRPGDVGGGEQQAARDDAQCSHTPEAYSSTTSWPTTCAGCR